MRLSLASLLSLLLVVTAVRAQETTAPEPATPATAQDAAPSSPAEIPTVTQELEEVTPPSTAEAAASTAPAAAATPAATAQVLPSGPLTVTADRAEFQKGGVMIYSGNVQLDAQGLALRGARLELRQIAGGHYSARIAGTPAQLKHQGGVSATGSLLPEVSAQAGSLIYDSSGGVVEISGNAELVRGSDRISGEMILYNVTERRIQATGGASGQVKIVIQPPASAEKTP